MAKAEKKVRIGAFEKSGTGTNVKTNVLSLALRLWAEQIFKKLPNKSKLLIMSADRLDDLEERIAIMTEPDHATDSELEFPPLDRELQNQGIPEQSVPEQSIPEREPLDRGITGGDD